jgi:hypothetical protein
MPVIPVPGDPCTEKKVGFASLLPGGMTLDAEPGNFRLLHDISPEPVNGPGGRKGIPALMAVYRKSRFIAG